MRGFLIRGFNMNKDYPVNIYRSILYTEGENLFLKTNEGIFHLNGGNSSGGSINLDNYYTKLEIDNILNNIQIDGYITIDDLVEYVTNDKLIEEIEKINQVDFNIDDYLKIEDLDNSVTTIVDYSIAQLLDGAPETFDTLREISDWIAQDESNTTYMLGLINSKVDSDEVDDMIRNLVTKEDLAAEMQNIVFPEVDLSDYYNIEEIDNKLSNIEVDVNLDNYYIKDEVDTLLLDNSVDLDGYATETFVTEAIDSINIPDINLDNYVTTETMDSRIGEAIAQAQLEGNEVDLTEYEKSIDVDDKLLLKADKTEIPSIEGLATETYVNDAIANINIPVVDLSTYETIISNDTKLALKADKTELDGLATEVFVSDAIANIEVVVDMDDYYNKSEIDNSLSTKADVLHTHSAIEISETMDRTFIDAPKKAQIDSNTTDIASLSQRIGNIESSSIITTDEKVKLNASSDAKYLEDFIDTDTLLSNNGKIQAISLSGLVASIHEVNQLTGITGNIQSQIDALNNIGNFTTSVDTYAELLNIVDMTTNDMVIVISDESRDNGTTIYIYNVDWKYAGVFKGGELRDFVQNPLRLETEVTGVLSKNNYEKQIASETSISNTNGNFTANNVEDALNELFTYANNIKSSVASAIGSPLTSSDTLTEIINKIAQIKLDLANSITNKGVVTYPYNTLNEMANKVRLIPNITMEGDLKSTGSFQVTTVPYIKTVLLNTPISEKDVTSTLIEYVYGATNVQHYIDNMVDDRNYSMPNQDIEFNGSLKVKTDYLQETSMVSENDEFTMYSTIVTMKTIKIKF